MKKVALSLATVLAAATFAPEASALPAFARQTGMACTACHFQHFPVLNGFGRAFKAAGYTMMGAQEKIEGEHLSIPATLNGAILLKYRYQKTNASPATVGAGKTAKTSGADGQWQMGDEFSLFFGGRVAETELLSIGFLMENNVANVGGAGNLVAGLRVPVNVDLGAAKAAVIPFTTDALGVAYGFELSSGGVMRANRWAENRRATSAIQYNADRNGGTLMGGYGAGAASGTAFVLQNDMGFVNFTRWSSSFAPGANGGAVGSTNYGQSYIRVAATPTIGDFAIVAGFGKESGSSYGNLDGKEVEANQTFLDFQGQGEVAGLDAGLYAQYANAPACTAVGVVCVHNTGTLARKAFTVGGEVSVIPHTLHVGAAYRNAKNGKADAAGAAVTDNAITLTAVYDLAQNVALHADISKYSGTAYNAAGSATTEFLGMLEASW